MNCSPNFYIYRKNSLKIYIDNFVAAADDEISFDPGDVITNIEMVRNETDNISGIQYMHTDIPISY